MLKLRSAAFLSVGLLVGALLGVLVLFINQKRAESQASSRRLPPTIGAPVQDFDLPRLGGTSQKLSGLQGKPVLINFWATWCPPCKEEMPLLERYAAQYRDQLVVLGIDYEEAPDIVQPYVNKIGVTFPILLDQDGQVSEMYYARNFPTTFFVDANGILRAQHLGLLTEDLLVRYLKTIGIQP
jgi:cytochrome c biogenesis protein CcmG, thiol:disulfide interchange protein DsbE